MVLARVVASLDALIEMGRRLGLRAQVQERLLAVLDAALEIRKLPGGDVDGAAPLILRVADVEVAYALEVSSPGIDRRFSVSSSSSSSVGILASTSATP